MTSVLHNTNSVIAVNPLGCHTETNDLSLTSSLPLFPLRVFGFVAKKPGSLAENVCHLFAELDPEQPATAIVNFINKVMLSQRR